MEYENGAIFPKTDQFNKDIRPAMNDHFLLSS